VKWLLNKWHWPVFVDCPSFNYISCTSSKKKKNKRKGVPSMIGLRVGNLLFISNDLNIFERKGRKEGEPLLAIQQ
jgi:hypothetical protein